jgi:putative transposase
MIEAFWRQLKNQWLYLNSLDSLETVRKLVQFYVDQHNSVVPHSAHCGQTPDEIYFGIGQEVPEQLAKRHLEARQQRLATNRQRSCSKCHSQMTLPKMPEGT